jgi:hypothetical protein
MTPQEKIEQDYDELRRLCKAAVSAFEDLEWKLDTMSSDANCERDHHDEWSGLFEIMEGVTTMREQLEDAHNLVSIVEETYHGDNE